MMRGVVRRRRFAEARLRVGVVDGLLRTEGEELPEIMR